MSRTSPIRCWVLTKCCTQPRAGPLLETQEPLPHPISQLLTPGSPLQVTHKCCSAPLPTSPRSSRTFSRSYRLRPESSCSWLTFGSPL